MTNELNPSKDSNDSGEVVDQLTAVKTQRPFRKAVLRGLGVLMPPLLTIVLFLWAWNVIVSYVLEPIENMVLAIAVQYASDIRDEPPEGATKLLYVPANETGGDAVDDQDSNNSSDQSSGTAASDSDIQRIVTRFDRRDGFVFNDKNYIRIKNQYIPETVYNTVEDNPGNVAPTTPNAFYRRYFQLRLLNRVKTVPIFLLVFVLVLYLFGKFLAAGIGRWIWNGVEGIVNRIPLISNVYSSVKQVTDFAFSQTELQYTRVVAVQYPRKGIWSMGFVTGEGMLDVRMAANEPVMTVLIPTSPMPATGFTITVPKSDTIDLNITIDQAIQFCVSCGVVVPTHQQHHHLNAPAGNGANPLLAGSKLVPPGNADESGESGEQNISSDQS